MANKKKAKTKKAKPRSSSGRKAPQRQAKPKKLTAAKNAEPPVKKAPAKKPAAKEKKGGGPVEWWNKSAQFFREVRVELKKVTWPTRKETLASSSVVIILVLISAAFLGLVDLGLSRLIRAIIG